MTPADAFQAGPSLDELRAAHHAGAAGWSRLFEVRAGGEAEVLRALAAASGLPLASMADLQAWIPLLDRVPLVKAQSRRGVLMRSVAAAAAGVDTAEEGGATPAAHDRAVLTDPWDDSLVAWLRAQSDRPVRLCLALPSDLHALFNQLEQAARATDAMGDGTTDGSDDQDVTETLTLASASEAGSPAVKLLNSALYDALKQGASDIHLEATATGLAVKCRIDGVLDTLMHAVGVDQAEQVISRLKVLAELDIAERRVPQDGSFRVAAQGRQIDLRVSIMPSVHGEDAVVRVLDKYTMLGQQGRLTLDALGMPDDTVLALRELVDSAYGMVLVTGPTGSGKTTTLYALLSEMHRGTEKIITIEDPVEYQIPGVLQIPVNDRKGLTFARGLRSILRHDPDRIMVGEIRDRETAEIAVQSALTGHMVLSTVHANSVYDVFGRFTHMGLDLYALASALNAVWAQRLVRVNCPHCLTEDVPSRALLARCGLASADTDLSRYRFLRGRGCGACRGTGYRGRRAVAELLRLDDELRELIVGRQPVRVLKERARLGGATTLFEAALALVADGVTTLEEVRRVTLAG